MPRNQSKAHRYFGFVLELVGLAGHTGVVINGGTCPVPPTPNSKGNHHDWNMAGTGY